MFKHLLIYRVIKEKAWFKALRIMHPAVTRMVVERVNNTALGLNRLSYLPESITTFLIVLQNTFSGLGRISSLSLVDVEILFLFF